jgi:hypothetical protein
MPTVRKEESGQEKLCDLAMPLVRFQDDWWLLFAQHRSRRDHAAYCERIFKLIGVILGQYKDLKTGTMVEILDEKNFVFPSTGAKMLLKSRPPISKDADTD